MSNKYKDRRQSRSARLRKYGNVYNQYVYTKKSDKNINEPVVEEKISDSTKRKKKVLNDYQKFFREESKKIKYRSMSSRQRMTEIANLWEKKKRRSRRKKS